MSKQDYQVLVKEASIKYGYPTPVALALVRQESNYNPDARSPVGALGIMQIMPRTAVSWGVDPRDAPASIDIAIKNLARYYRTYQLNHSKDEAVRLSLAAYNAGPGAVAKYNGVPPYRETQNYVASIMKNAS